ncbi:MAG: SUMF1/EgtB/PvdO family nonheme iron enzyme [Polyangiaceae bacterium]|nr:SUMF1/EgtB/PvdO family nonheme iron enzyme [Polyangiaceae bacterium]
MRSALLVTALAAIALLGCDRSPVPRTTSSQTSSDDEGVGLELPAAITPAALALTKGVKAASAQPPICPAGMALVEGSYCSEVRHRCLSFLDGAGPYAEFRCERYAEPAECVGARRPVRFCMDVDEYTPKGETLPENFHSYTHAKKICGGLGKRVCLESEWNFACEGEEMRPYPYGFERDSAACNADQTDLVNAEGTLRDRRAPSNAHPRCVSPFGIRNLSGNLEEFVQRDDVRPEAPAMKGAYWQPGRNTCRAAQTAHDAYYNGMETGFRCCADPAP